MPMPSARLLLLLDAAAAAGVAVWLDGGWGVDALLGAQHRVHDDADLVVRLEDVERLTVVLSAHGFSVAVDDLPTRLVLRTPDGEQVDLHPVTFDADGHGWQAGAAPDGSACRYPADQFVDGTVDGRSVPCLGPQVQLEHHCGYVPRPHDISDMRRLTSRFALAMPEHYPDEDRRLDPPAVAPPAARPVLGGRPLTRPDG
jgi:lincosamide nucleotidyltransferase A/C/D/E